MKFKKIAKVILSCMMAGALFAGCGGSSGDDKPAADKPAETKIGMLTHMNATETTLGEMYNAAVDKAGLNTAKYNPKFYDSLRAMQMGIEAGEVAEVSLYKSVADYIIANNDKFELVQNDVLGKLKDSFCFAVRNDSIQLKADLDRIIGDMQKDGTLDKLTNEYIIAVNRGQAPPAVEIPTTEGAESIKVGVTGDLPPLDLILPDNSPAGFNTALLAEIANRLGKNVAIVQVESGARASALASKQIDVVFWAVVPAGDHLPADIDKPEGLEFSAPYFEDSVAHVKLKADK